MLPKYRAQVEAEDREREAYKRDRRAVRSLVDVRAAEISEAAWEAQDRRDGVLVKQGPDWLRVTLPLDAWGVNEERAGGWRQHRSRTRVARDFTNLALSGRSLPGFAGVVEIEATTYGHRLDPGSDLPLVKAVVDGLVDLGVLAGDSAKHVSRVILNAPASAGPARVTVEIRALAV